MNHTTEVKMSKEDEAYYRAQYREMVAEFKIMNDARIAEHQARMSRFYTAPYNNQI